MPIDTLEQELEGTPDRHGEPAHCRVVSHPAEHGVGGGRGVNLPSGAGAIIGIDSNAPAAPLGPFPVRGT